MEDAAVLKADHRQLHGATADSSCLGIKWNDTFEVYLSGSGGERALVMWDPDRFLDKPDIAFST